MSRLDFILTSVREAGSLLLQKRDEGFSTETKNNDPKNIVTSTDRDLNEFLITKIKATFPDEAIFSEEGSPTERVEAAPALWVIDPIDGSSNFSRGIPHFAVCLAFVSNGTPEAGAVYNPITKELFSFEKGKGAFLNGVQIKVSNATELKDSFVLFHAGRKPGTEQWGGDSYTKLLKTVKKTSNFAGCALDTCFVAAGRVEASVYGTFTTLDSAAPVGVLMEAGGCVMDERGNTPMLSNDSLRIIVANNTQVADALRTLLF